MKLVKLLANLGYGSRKEMAGLIRAGRVPDAVIDRMITRWEVPDATEAHSIHPVLR